VRIEKLVEPGEFYLQPVGDRAVQDRREEQFPYVIGADGQHSVVRESLRLDCEKLGETESFVIYEFSTDSELPHEVRVAMDQDTTNVLWPLSDRRCRWSFQLTAAEVLGETKARQTLATKPAELEKALVQHVRKLLEERAPWFEGNIRGIDWWIGGCFERRLATRFGRGRCWLAGDAAHRTSPIGVQSLNLGFTEAIDVADAVAKTLHEGDGLDWLEKYGARHREEWASLLSPGSLKATDETNPWILKHRDRILSCLPASGRHLDDLLEQLGLRRHSATPVTTAT
jgi:2-polyprenyl-6-methoxyphenol hydroxylase-like FAD-dependent oxidoreductase